MKFKYQKYYEELGRNTQCPPKDAFSEDKIGFRFVYDTIDHPDNFVPQYFKSIPPRVNCPNDSICSKLALSFFISEEKAQERYSGFPKRTKDLLGYKNIASGQLERNDGLMTIANSEGHFDFHMYENIDISNKFKIIAALQ